MHRFEYDAGGSRTVKRDPATTTVYAGEHYRCTGATIPSSNTVSCTEHQYSVFVGDRLVAEITKDSLGNTEKQRYVHSDHLGSSTVITDETGTIIEKRGFKPFGQAMATFTDPDLRAGFTGHEHDSELGLINMRGRMYDPKLRRFVTPDPFVTEPWNPAGLNRLAYVHNSPMNFVDPSGFQEGAPDHSGGGYTYIPTGQSGGECSGCGAGPFSIDSYSIQTPVTQSVTGAYPDSYGGNQSREDRLIRGEGGGQAVAQGPDPSSMARTDSVGSDQIGGTTTTATGPYTDTGPQRSGDGSGQPTSAKPDPTIGQLAGGLVGYFVERGVCGFFGCGSAGGAIGEDDPEQMSETEKLVNSLLTATGLTGISAIIGKGAPKPSPKFEPPTNPEQLPPSSVPPGWRVRVQGRTEQYPNGYWVLEKPMGNGGWQRINPSTMKPGPHPDTHVPLPPGSPK